MCAYILRSAPHRFTPTGIDLKYDCVVPRANLDPLKKADIAYPFCKLIKQHKVELSCDEKVKRVVEA